MAMSRNERRLLIAAGLVSATVPLIALYPCAFEPRPGGQAAIATIEPPALPAPVRVYERPLFAIAEGDTAPADAPVLTGIAGRLNRDAVALVRLADGGAHAGRRGERRWLAAGELGNRRGVLHARA